MKSDKTVKGSGTRKNRRERKDSKIEELRLKKR